MGGARSESSHDLLLQDTLGIGSYNKLYSFKYLVNGFAVHTTASQVKKLKDLPGVKMVERDRRAKLMTTYTPRFLGLTADNDNDGDDDLAIKTVRGAGEEMVIGFVDSGIDPRHPSFAYHHPKLPLPSPSQRQFPGVCEAGPHFPSSSCNGKIVSARFFSAGARSIATLNTSLDFLSPFDAVGHGTHVASTAAGNAGVPVVVNGFHYGRASGMAPQARIAVYKAVYPTVGTLADVIAAMDQAIHDEVDVLVVSVGPDTPPEDTDVTFLSVFDVTMLFARRAGVFVVQAAGNLGPDPFTVVSYSPWAVGVAACRTDRTYPAFLVLGDDVDVHQFVSGVGLSAPTLGSFLLVLARDAVMPNGSFPRTPPYVDECQHPEALDPSLVQGRIVLCTFSAGFYDQTSTLAAITQTAAHLGFMGFVLVANPAYGDFIAQPIPFDAPAGIIIPKLADTQTVLRYYEQHISRDEMGHVTEFHGRASIGEGRVAKFGGRAPIVSRFSSRGPDYADAQSQSRQAADVLKPDILAPGDQVWAAWSPLSVLEPLLVGYSFALLSGTSMATPHVGGIAALIKQCHPSWNPSMIASAISTTASKYDSQGDLISAEEPDLYGVHPSTYFGFGAGLINPARALDPGLVLSSKFEDYIDFLCSLSSVDWVKVRAATGASCSRPLAHPADLNLPSVTISALRVGQPVQIQRSFTSVGSKPETYLCSVLSPNGTSVTLSPTWFRIAPMETQAIHMEFNATQALNAFSFGEIVLTGSLDHIVRLPLSIHPVLPTL
ncbi:unnamed protein product [Linum tenue]|uniref:Subtilisin-like protease SBT2.4 n=3 Tax=Linum tenue TaxID=586396 RepID=A0AAV0P9L9_9ROSI|nr:unnamed protein product [Linum tenue]